MQRSRSSAQTRQGALLQACVSDAYGSAIDKWPRGSLGLYAAGFTILAYSATLALVSKYRNDGAIVIETTRWLLVAASVIAGVLFLTGLCWARVRPARSTDLAIIITVGLAARIILIPAAPIFVSDFYRYLWDGAVTATGTNPWIHTPQSMLSALADPANSRDVPPHLVELARTSGQNMQSINHPDLSTIYPATAQAVFAIAYWIKPWSLAALRAVLLLFDSATVLLLIVLLRSMNRPLHGIAWYWWNPLLLREVSHSAHMDVIVLPFVLIALLLAVRRSTMLASLILALAVGAKVWPIVLIPLLIRMAARRLSEVVRFLAIFVVASTVLWLPVVMGMLAGSSGFLAYASTWYNNDAVFRAIEWLTQRGLVAFKLNPGFAPPMARLIVSGLLAGCIIQQTRRLVPNVTELVRRSLLIIAAVFMLSPTQFPWYYLWMLPLLAAAPRLSLLTYTALLPLYYFHYDFPWIVWVEHLPILAWFLIETRKLKRQSEASPVLAGGI